MVVDELARFQDVIGDSISWTRPSFFEIRYELICPAGVLCRISVQGIGGGRQVFAETAEDAWKFSLFPLNRREAPILRVGSSQPEALYIRENPVEVRFLNGSTFRIQPESAVKTRVDKGDGGLVFTVEMGESFPRWRADLKLESDSLALPELPVLAASACCFLVFT